MNYTVAQIMHLVEERYITFLNNQTYDFHLADDKTDRITGGTLCGKVHFAYFQKEYNGNNIETIDKFEFLYILNACYLQLNENVSWFKFISNAISCFFYPLMYIFVLMTSGHKLL